MTPFSKEWAGKLNLVVWPNPVLSKECEEVPDGVDVKFLMDRMLTIMLASGGVGLAAPQLGVSLRLFVLSPIVFPEGGAFINPSLRVSGHKENMAEGCLSIPGIRANIPRHPSVTLTAKGRPPVLLRGWAAQAAQHEMEHLEGKLRLSRYWGR